MKLLENVFFCCNSMAVNLAWRFLIYVISISVHICSYLFTSWCSMFCFSLLETSVKKRDVFKHCIMIIYWHTCFPNILSSHSLLILINRQELPVDRMGSIPMCMFQFSRLYSCCKIPGKEKDSLKANFVTGTNLLLLTFSWNCKIIIARSLTYFILLMFKHLMLRHVILWCK